MPGNGSWQNIDEDIAFVKPQIATLKKAVAAGMDAENKTRDIPMKNIAAHDDVNQRIRKAKRSFNLAWRELQTALGRQLKWLEGLEYMKKQRGATKSVKRTRSR